MKKIIKAISTAGLTLLATASSVLGQDGVDNTTITIGEPERGVNDFSKLITSGLQAAIVIAAVLTFAYLILGGIQWITSGGDKTAYEEARGKITAALIGLGIVVAAWAIMQLVGAFFGLDILELNIPTAGK